MSNTSIFQRCKVLISLCWLISESCSNWHQHSYLPPHHSVGHTLRCHKWDRVKVIVFSSKYLVIKSKWEIKTLLAVNSDSSISSQETMGWKTLTAKIRDIFYHGTYFHGLATKNFNVIFSVLHTFYRFSGVKLFVFTDSVFWFTNHRSSLTLS